MSGSIGIITAIGVSAILGWFLILGLLFSIQDLDGTLSSSTGQPVTQIFLDTVGERGAIALMVIFWRVYWAWSIWTDYESSIGYYYCRYVFLRVSVAAKAPPQDDMYWMTDTRTFSITSNSRMMYAFSRDGGIPGHKFLAKVSPQWKSPIRTGAPDFFASLLLGLAVRWGSS